MKNKNICIFFICITMITGYAFAANIPVKAYNDQQFDNAFHSYIYKKNASELPIMMNYLSTSNLLMNKNAKAPLQGFFMGILHQNPTAFKNLQSMKLSPSASKILKFAKEFSPDMEMILNNKIGYYPESGEFLDTLWGYFYATGDSRVIKKMCQIKENDKNPIIRRAAEWSLESNAKQYSTKIKDCKMY